MQHSCMRPLSFFSPIYLSEATYVISSFSLMTEFIVSSPPGIKGNDFYVISQAGGATAKLQEPGRGHIQGGEDDFRQSSKGGTALS